ncbi:MAG TPA: glycosyltransferase family 9 protein [Bacteroidota bacterium]|nr:glycosyltransferase family 9 protein [Bacteroidota bacterium]
MKKTLLKSLEIAFRHAVVYPILRLIVRNEVIKRPVDIGSIRKLLIFRADGIGDMIVSTPMFKRIKEANPHLHLAVFASKRNVDIIRFNPHIDRIYILHNNPLRFLRELAAARKENYDVVIDFVFNRTTLEGIMANVIAPRGIKIGQGADKYSFYFNRMIPIDHTGPHMVEILTGMIHDVFGLPTDPARLRYEIIVDDKSKNRVDMFLQKCGLKRRGRAGGGSGYMVLNFAAVDVVRRVSVEQATEIIRLVRQNRPEQPVLIFPPSDRKTLDAILQRSGHEKPLVYPEEGTAGLLEIASLIEGAVYVVTPDTSIIHFASATQTPLFALYTPTAARNHQWLPYGVFYRSIRAMLGSAVSSLSLADITEALTQFWKELDVSHMSVQSSAGQDA